MVEFTRAQESEGKIDFSYRTIGEVSKELELPSHVLRFWETKFKQIKPLKRKGGHRYYSHEDVTFIKEIKILLHERGYTIKGAQKYLDEHDRIITEAVEAVAPLSQQDLFSGGGNQLEKPPLNEEKKKAISDLVSELKSVQSLIKKEFSN